jgi:hypothetical protein
MRLNDLYPPADASGYPVRSSEEWTGEMYSLLVSLRDLWAPISGDCVQTAGEGGV